MIPIVSKSPSLHGAGGGTRTPTMSPSADFESATSTNSITPAGSGNIIHENSSLGKSNFFSLSVQKMSRVKCRKIQSTFLCNIYKINSTPLTHASWASSSSNRPAERPGGQFGRYFTWTKQYSSACEPSAMVTRQVMRAFPLCLDVKRTPGFPSTSRSSKLRMLGSSTLQETS